MQLTSTMSKTPAKYPMIRTEMRQFPLRQRSHLQRNQQPFQRKSTTESHPRNPTDHSLQWTIRQRPVCFPESWHWIHKTDCERRRIPLWNDVTQHWKWSERHGRVSPFSGCYRLSVQKWRKHGEIQRLRSWKELHLVCVFERGQWKTRRSHPSP